MPRGKGLWKINEIAKSRETEREVTVDTELEEGRRRQTQVTNFKWNQSLVMDKGENRVSKPNQRAGAERQLGASPEAVWLVRRQPSRKAAERAGVRA